MIRRQRRDGFVGRQGELAVFAEALRQTPETAIQFLFHIHGPAGVGKSTLLRRLESEARERQAVTACVDESVADVMEAMETISTQCSQQGMNLKNFDKALATYRQRRHEADAASGSVPAAQPAAGESDTGSGNAMPNPSSGSLVASQLGLVGLGMLPGVGAFTGAVDPNQVAVGADRIKAMLSTRFRNHDDIQLIMTPLRVLTPIFLQDLAEVAQRHPWVVLIFDTYERTGPLLDSWLRDILLSDRYGELSANVLVLLAGQNRLDTGAWVDCLDLITYLPLEVFTESEARRFLMSKGIIDERTVEVILRLSGRLPVLLSTLAETRPASAEDVGDPSGTAVERFLKWETDPARRAAALACALPQEFDEDICHVSAGEDTAGLFDWLRSLPFVTNRAGRCRYHDVVRDTMLRLQRQQSPARWKEQHTRLSAAFQNQRNHLEYGGPPENDWWESQDWRNLRLQETYHSLCAEPHTALSQVLRELLDAYDHSVATLRRWVLMLVQAGLDADAREVLDWGQQLITVLDTDDDQHPESMALALLADRAHLNSEGKSFVHLLRGRDYRNSGRPELALVQYNKSIALSSENSRAYYGRGVTYQMLDRYEEALADLNRAIDLAPQDCDYFAQRGAIYLLMGKHPEAIADLERAIELNFQDATNLTMRAFAYQQVNRYEEALTDLNRAIEFKPDYEWAIAQRGITYQEMNRYEESLTDLNRAIELDPQDTWNLAQRGVTYREMGRYEESLTDFNRAIELDPQDTWNLAQRGATYRQMKRYEEALTDLNRAIELDPQDSWNISQRGVTYREMGRYEEALTDLNRAIELKPDYEWAIAQRGATYRQTERYEEALTDLNRAIELDPQDTWNLAQRGVTYRQMKRYEESLTDLNRAIELKPDYEWPIAQRGATYREMERYEEALADFNRAIELKPDYEWAIAQRGVTYREMGRYEESLTDLNRAIELDPQDTWNFSQRGATYRQMGRYEESLTDLNRAIELDPQDSWYFSQRGIIYRLLSRYEESLTDFNRAIELKPDHEWAISQRGVTYREMGRYEESLTDLNRAIELDPQDTWNFSQRV
ncbi:tetratricopeptide repeat protein, partial [Streptomyces sp. NPDC021080]|uniref:tetratricopeptide repeat protein n=1 Tax=Streptomyces sp. NPDC021080 TaxID=3365110 RepID=UPI0037896844